MSEEAKTALGVADLREILKLLPHRYPFLLVDKIIEIDGDDSAIGITWGGVVSNSLSIQIAHDSAGTGQYFSVSGGLLRGERVADNWSAEASAGAYWRVLGRGDTGLSVGIHAAGMHYEKNLSFFTLGHGGYFSPQRYFLASVPSAWSGRKSQIEYEIRASAGAQYIAQDATPVFPTGVFDSEAIYQADVNRAANYDVLLRLAYRLAPHWFLGVQAGANNTRSFRSQTAGVTLRYLFRRLPTNTELRVKSIPDWRGNQPFGI